MTFNEYQEHIRQFDRSPGTPWYYALGLNGEAGEASEKIKKYYRDGTIDPAGLAAELGDTLWYLARLADTFGIRLADVATGNISKLTARAATSTLHGSGDNREKSIA